MAQSNMNIFNKVASKLFPKKLEEKQGSNLPIFSDLFANSGWYDLMAYQALLYYRMISPIYTGINAIADEMSNIKPYVFDVKKNEFIEHDVLKLLDHPYADTTWEEFIKEFAAYFLITGNNYTILTGDVHRPPVEMMNIYPPSVSIMANTQDGYNDVFNITNLAATEQFKRNEKLYPGYFRFINQFGNREIWQTKNFNPQYQLGYGQYGMSALTPIYYEIYQHLYSSIHNKSLLQNGAKIDTIFSVEGQLTDQQLRRLKEEITKFYSGAANAGRPFLSEAGLKVDSLGSSNIDMDFLNLKQEVTNAIYNSLKVPLPLISNDHTTMNNMNASILMLYDRAVLPVVKRILKELTLLLMPRYKNSEDYIITYKQCDITALELRKIDIVKSIQGIGIYTTNELRKIMGLDEIDGGDNLFIPSTNLPINSFGESDAEAAKSYIESLKNIDYKNA